MDLCGAESRYDERIFREAVKENPNFRWCANPECAAPNLIENGYPHPSLCPPLTNILLFSINLYSLDGQASYFICPSCNANTCFSCSEYAHPKRTCAEYKTYIQSQGTSGDAHTVAYLNEISVTCYNCESLLQRTEGCVLIACLKCRSLCCAGCGGRGHGHECRRLPSEYLPRPG